MSRPGCVRIAQPVDGFLCKRPARGPLIEVNRAWRAGTSPRRSGASHARRIAKALPRTACAGKKRAAGPERDSRPRWGEAFSENPVALLSGACRKPLGGEIRSPRQFLAASLGTPGGRDIDIRQTRYCVAQKMRMAFPCPSPRARGLPRRNGTRAGLTQINAERRENRYASVLNNTVDYIK